MQRILFTMFVAIVATASSVCADGTNDLVWQVFRPAMLAYQAGGSRGEFLATCKKLKSRYPGSRYDEQLDALIAPLEREVARPKPPVTGKDARNRTEIEDICYWIYQLRDLAGHQWSDPGSPELFSMDGINHTAADCLVSIGPPAIPYLIEALEDDTPTRTIAWQRSFYPIYFVLRRQDVAIKCLERIVGCQFYDEGSTSMHFYRDTPERQQSVIANIKTWWARSEDVTQAQMIRNQLALRSQNIALRGYDRVHALETLAMLEGPEAVVVEGAMLLAEDRYGLNSPVRSFLDQVDPRLPVRQVFDRFWRNQQQEGDLTYVLQYGNNKAYAELARRFATSGNLDGGSWNAPDQIRWAALYGLNWAIPIVATALDDDKLTMKYKNDVTFVAVGKLQELTGKDFRYHEEADNKDKQAALERALVWWEREGKTTMAKRIVENHPPVVDPGDLFLDDAQLQAQVASVNDDDNQRRRDAIAGLGTIRTYQTQRVLLNALRKEPLVAERVKILRILGEHPNLWHLPELASRLERDESEDVRLRAAASIKAIIADKSRMTWWTRLETREAALALARKIAADKQRTAEMRRGAVDILIAWNSFVDQPLLRSLASDPVLQAQATLRSHVDRMDSFLKQIPTPQPPRE